MNRMITLAIVDQIQRCISSDTTGEDIDENYTFQYALQMKLITPGIINVARRFLLEIEHHKEDIVENYLNDIVRVIPTGKPNDSEKLETQAIQNENIENSKMMICEEEKEEEKSESGESDDDDEDEGSYDQLCSTFGLLANIDD